jgi:hypothetical protein
MPGIKLFTAKPLAQTFMGRQKVDERVRRSKVIAIRFTDDELKAIEAHAARRARSLADHVREIMRKAAAGLFGNNA